MDPSPARPRRIAAAALLGLLLVVGGCAGGVEPATADPTANHAVTPERAIGPPTDQEGTSTPTVLVPRTADEAIEHVPVSTEGDFVMTYLLASRLTIAVDEPRHETLWELTVTDDWAAWRRRTIDTSAELADLCEYHPAGGPLATEGCEANPSPAPGPHANPGALHLALGMAGPQGLQEPTSDRDVILALADRLGVGEVLAFSTHAPVLCDGGGLDCDAFGVVDGELADVENHVFDSSTGLQLYWDRWLGEHLLARREVLSLDLDAAAIPR